MVFRQQNYDLFDELSTPYSPAVATAIKALSSNSGVEARGAIFTRSEVVEFILDLVGYTESKPLHKFKILEPSFGDGDFLITIIQRLLTSWRKFRLPDFTINDLIESIRAVELHQDTYSATRRYVINMLKQEGFNALEAEKLANQWLINGDFLLDPIGGAFDFVAGNPPYVRQEQIPNTLLVEYRKRYHTMFDRADLYIPFIERSLSLLSEGGHLSFICADRWMKNKYGGPLRNLIADQFYLKTYIDMVDTPAFHSEVIAYPAITVISRERPGKTRIAYRPNIDQKTLSILARKLVAKELPKNSVDVREIDGVTNSFEPWLLESPDQMALIRRLEHDFPQLEEVGCKVGIGVATGADKAFIDDYELLDVESDRKEPLAMTKDIMSGEVKWNGLGVVNPFSESGGLVNLDDYPRLRLYLENRKEQIIGRHCAQKDLKNWYRTIDRITPALTKRPKLLIPDIKGEANVVFEEGNLYPHHNLYHITSDVWDLRALQAVMLSSVTRLFIATYSTKMRGGFLRFQAQYLRRLRLPLWEEVSDQLRDELTQAALSRDLATCNSAVCKLYKLSIEEISALKGNEE